MNFDMIKLKQSIRTMQNCYMNTDSFIINIKTDVYEDIANDVEKRFDIFRPLSTGKNKKVIRLMKDEYGGKILTEFTALQPKTYSYLMGDGNSDNKARGTKKMCHKMCAQVY